MSDVVIKPLLDLQDMYEAVRLQQIYWGTDVESVVPAHMLYTIALYGGQVLVAMDDDRMVGVLIGLLGADIESNGKPAMANLMIASKRMVVLPEYRSRGIGHQLKLAQRDYAMQQGIRLVTWTFDPLLSRNAHLNIRKLGAISQKYVENLYGTDDNTGLASLGSSDRLSIEWWVWTPRIESRVAGQDEKPTYAIQIERGASVINPASFGSFAQPSDQFNPPDVGHCLIEIPFNMPEIIDADSGLARVWRTHTRDIFQRVMSQGFMVTDFIHETIDEHHRAFYVMTHREQFDFNVGDV